LELREAGDHLLDFFFVHVTLFNLAMGGEVFELFTGDEQLLHYLYIIAEFLD